MKKDFSKLTFNSKLFKGRSDWYFCYLKSEKLAHVLAVLAKRSVSDSVRSLHDVGESAIQVTENITYAAAGEITEEKLLASLFGMLSRIHFLVDRGHISRETARVLAEEYELVIERLANSDRHLGLVVSPQDLSVPAVLEEPLLPSLHSFPNTPHTQKDIKDIYKGQDGERTQKSQNHLQGQGRTALILNLVRKSDGVSIKDISKVVQGCSEKTIQRELNTMIEQGMVVRAGERRWSTYHSP